MTRRRPPRRRSRNSLRSLAIAAAALLIAGVFGGQQFAPLIEEALHQILPGAESDQTTRSAGGEITGRVTRIADGDTFTIGSQRIRLCGVNTPERGEPGYSEAGDALERMTQGATVQCRPVGSGTPCDRRSSATSYDRVVAQCFVGQRDLAAELVRQGHAEDWTRYSGGYYAP